MKTDLYLLTNYICKSCGSCILQKNNNKGSGGGNPLFICTSCKTSTCAITPDSIGFKETKKHNKTNNELVLSVIDEIEWRIKSRYNPTKQELEKWVKTLKVWCEKK